MFKKIVKVFYGTDCLPYKDKELTVHYPITGNSFLGASNSTEIRFYIDKIGDIEDTWVANSKLPNGKMGNYLFQNADKGQDEDGNYLALEVSSFYTQAKGDVYISLNGFYGGVQIDDSGDVPVISGIPTIQATGCIKFSVYYATPLIDGEEVEQITLAQVLAEIGKKLDKDSPRYLKIIDNIAQINNDPNNAEFYFANDIVYDRTTTGCYKLSGTFPSLTYALVDLDVDDLFVNGDFNVLGDAIFGNEVRVEKGATYLTFDENGNVSLQDYLDEKQNQIPVVALSTLGGTISNTSVLNSLANFPSYITYEYGGDKSVFLHCRTDGTYYYFRKQYKESIHDNGSYIIYGGDVYIQVNKTTGAYSQVAVQHNWYSKDQTDSNFAHSIDLSIDSNYDLVVKLLDKSGNELARDDIDLPLESIVVSATYYDTYTYDGTTYSKVIVIVLATTDVPTIIPVGDLVDGLATTTDLTNGLATKQNVIDSSHKLSADLVEDGTTNKVFTATEQTKLSGIESGAQVNVLEGVQLNGNDLTIENKKVNITGLQDTLVSGTNIKTINNTSLLGSGNYTFDDTFNESSTNAVQNQLISKEIREINYELAVIREDLFETILTEIDYKVNYGYTYAIPDTLTDTDGTHRVVFSETALKTIEFNSVVMNQLVQNGNFANSSGWYTTGSSATISVSNKIATITKTANSTIRLYRANSEIPSVGNNKYLCAASVKISASGSVCIGCGDVEQSLQQITPNEWTELVYIASPTSNGTYRTNINDGNTLAIGDTLQVQTYMLVNLTKLGWNDVTSTSDTRIQWLLSLGYIPANSGSLLSTTTTGIQVKDSSDNVLGTISIQETSGKSALSVHDYIEVVEGNIVEGEQLYNLVLHTLVGSVDLGTFNWVLYAENIFAARIPNTTPTSIRVLNVKGYEGKAYLAYLQDKQICFDSNGYTYIKDTNYSDKDVFRAAMNGVYLYYELSTPTTQTIATDLRFDQISSLIQQVGTINALFTNVPPNVTTTFVVKKAVGE